MFRFVHPWYLLGLLVPLGLWLFESRWKRRPFLKFSLFSRVRSLFPSGDTVLMRMDSFFLYFALALFIVGLARPQWGRSETEVTSEGIDIMLSVDASGSMAAMDFKLDGEMVDRLVVVKKV